MPVEDLMDLGVEAVAAGAEIALTKKETEEDKKNKKRSSLFSVILAILMFVSLLYLLFLRWNAFGGEGMAMMIDDFGYVGFIVLILGILVFLFLIGLFSRMNKEKKLKKIYIFIFLSAVSSFMLSYVLTDFSQFNIIEFIPLIAFTFAITLMFFLLFEKIGEVKVNQFLRFPYHLLIRFFIPLMFVCILFLGAMAGKYNYESVFLEEAEAKLTNDFGNVFGKAVYGLTETIFTLGKDRPNFFIFLSIALILYLLYSTIRYAFWKDEWPYPSLGQLRDDVKAQYFIDEVRDDRYLSKEDLNAFNRGKLRLNKKYLKGGQQNG